MQSLMCLALLLAATLVFLLAAASTSPREVGGSPPSTRGDIDMEQLIHLFEKFGEYRSKADFANSDSTIEEMALDFFRSTRSEIPPPSMEVARKICRIVYSMLEAKEKASKDPSRRRYPIAKVERTEGKFRERTSKEGTSHERVFQEGTSQEETSQERVFQEETSQEETSQGPVRYGGRRKKVAPYSKTPAKHNRPSGDS